MTLWRYSCKVVLPCLRSWKSQDVTSSGLTARKLEHNSMRSCFQDRMVPGGMFVYHRCAKPFNARTSAFALHAVPPPDASMVASYLRRNSSGSDSPSNCGNIAGLRRWATAPPPALRTMVIFFDAFFGNALRRLTQSGQRSLRPARALGGTLVVLVAAG